MSRTIRRKNYENENRTSWDNQGRKLFGFYTVSYYEINSDGRLNCLYRAPTDTEYCNAFHKNHSDHGHYRYSNPAKWYRKFKIKKYRQGDKREIRKFMIDKNHEPMCRTIVASDYWD